MQNLSMGIPIITGHTGPKHGIHPNVHQQMNKHNVVYPNNGILFSNKLKSSPDTCYQATNWKHVKKEVSHWRSHIVWFHFYDLSRVGKSIETNSRWEVARCEREAWVGFCCEYWKLDNSDFWAILWIYWKPLNYKLCFIYLLIVVLGIKARAPCVLDKALYQLAILQDPKWEP
jgi:hypothetical protein